MDVHAFLSYSHKNKRLAHELKKALEEFGFKVFLAHEDISPSAFWQKEILSNLRACNIFMPILTKEFAESKWTDQETGFALARGKVIVPIKVDVNPYGFIGVTQALRLRKSSSMKACWAMVKSLKDNKRLGEFLKGGAIRVFLHSGTFEEAAENLLRLSELRPFPVAQLRGIIEGSSRNQNIYGCWRARPLMEGLIREAQGRVSARIISKYRRAVRSWG